MLKPGAEENPPRHALRLDVPRQLPTEGGARLVSAFPRRVCLHGADESLRSLLSDVLGDLGIQLRAEGDAAPADVVLALVQREDSVPQVLRAVHDASGPVPVLVLLPFEDERLRRLAMRLGARGCYALGTPLESLTRLLGDPSLSEAPRAWGESGRHNEEV